METVAVLVMVALTGSLGLGAFGRSAATAIAGDANAAASVTAQPQRRGAVLTSAQAIMGEVMGAAVVIVDGVIVSGVGAAATKVWRDTRLLNRMNVAVNAGDAGIRYAGGLSVVRDGASRASVTFGEGTPRKVARQFPRAWAVLERRLGTPLEPEDAYRLLKSFTAEQIHRVSEAIWDPANSEKSRLGAKSGVGRLHREKPIDGWAEDATTDLGLFHADRIQDGFRSLAMLPDDAFDRLTLNPRFWENASVGELDDAAHLWGARWNGRPAAAKDASAATPAQWHDPAGLHVEALDEGTHGMTYQYRKGIDPLRLPTPVRLTIDASRTDVIRRLRLTEPTHWGEQAPWLARLTPEGAWQLDLPTTERIDVARKAVTQKALAEYRYMGMDRLERELENIDDVLEHLGE